MDFIDVLRFEDINQRGPYSSPLSPYSFDNCSRLPKATRMRNLFIEHRAPQHPPPTSLGEPWVGRNMAGHEVCGFKDLDQVCDWFSDEEVELMLDHGFSLVSYQVPAKDVTIGIRQVCFVQGCLVPSVILQARSSGSLNLGEDLMGDSMQEDSEDSII